MKNDAAFKLVLLLAVAICFISCSTSRKEPNEEINDLLEKVDSSINRIQVTVESIHTIDRSVLRELYEWIHSDSNGGGQKILQKALKTTEAWKYKLVIKYLNDSTRVFCDYGNELENHVAFYQPGRSYFIESENKTGDKKRVSIENYTDRFDRQFATTAHLFGRGLSAVTDYPTDLEQISEGVYRLTVYDKKNCYKKKMECILDADKDYCWTSRKIFALDGSVQSEYIADDFRQTNGSWFPYRVEMKSYRKETFGTYTLLRVKEIVALPDDVKELNVENDIPEDAEIYKRNL